jgi:hypothetical protein
LPQMRQNGLDRFRVGDICDHPQVEIFNTSSIKRDKTAWASLEGDLKLKLQYRDSMELYIPVYSGDISFTYSLQLANSAMKQTYNSCVLSL